jgi:hypothetical protein
MLVLERLPQLLQAHSSWQWGYWYPAWHVVWELLGYVVSWYVLKYQTTQDVLSSEMRRQLKWWTLVGAVLGAKTVPILESLASGTVHGLLVLGVGKSLAGGLLGGILGSELGKYRLGITLATGDVLVYPLLVGSFVGRLGCASTAVWDGMLGQPLPVVVQQSLPYLGVAVTPAFIAHGLSQAKAGIYWNVGTVELMGLVVLAVVLHGIKPVVLKRFATGAWFYMFCLGYFLLRFGLEGLKHGGHTLTVVMSVSLIGGLFALSRLFRLRSNV